MTTQIVGATGIDKVQDGTIVNADVDTLAASKLTGTIADARFPATLPAASAANLTAIPAANITGTLPAISGANLTGLASPAITKVTQAYTSETRSAFGYSRDLYANNLNFVGHKVGFTFNKASASTDLLIQFEMSCNYFRDTYVCAIYTGSSGSATNIKRFAFNGTNSIGSNDDTAMTVAGHAIWTGITATGSQTWYWAIGRANDAYNSSYVLNPNTTDNASLTGDTSSHITVYEGDFS